MSGDAHGSSPAAEKRALELRLAEVEAEIRVVKAGSDAKAAVAEAKLVQEKLERKLESAAHKARAGAVASGDRWREQAACRCGRPDAATPP